MKKTITLLSLVILLSSTVNAQQKAKPTSPVKTQTKEKPQDSTVFQSIWKNNTYLGTIILEMEKPVYQKEILKEFLNNEFKVKNFEQLQNLEQKFYSVLPNEIFLQEKSETFKVLIDKIQLATSTSELNNISIEIQQCINPSYLPSDWDNKAWLNGFKTK